MNTRFTVEELNLISIYIYEDRASLIEEKGGKGRPKEEKQSIRAQLKRDAGKEKATTKKAATKKKNNDLEV